MPRLSKEHKTVLRSMLTGSQLKSHRYLDGVKVYRLHAVEDNNERPVTPAAVELLFNLGLIRSNMKFPAATYLLTQSGVDTAAQLDKTPGAAKPAAPPIPPEPPQPENRSAAPPTPVEETADTPEAKPAPAKRSRKKNQ